MTRIDCFRWDFQYLAFHGDDEITAVITRLPNHGRTDLTTVMEGDVLSIWDDVRKAGVSYDVMVVDVWTDEAAGVWVFHASRTSLSSSRSAEGRVDPTCEHTGCNKPGTFDGLAWECDEHRIPVPGRKYE